MRKGKKYEWIIPIGKGDPGSTGRALAAADWQRIRLAIINAERPDEDKYGMIVFKSAQDQHDHHSLYQNRDDWQKSGLAETLSFEDWQQLQEFKAWQNSKAKSLRDAAANGPNVPPGVPSPSGSKPFKDITAVFAAHLQYRLKQTRPGLKSSEDISESRFAQYGFALAHLDSKEGETPIEPEGTFHIGVDQMTKILERYRPACKEEMAKENHSGHWFNERMKTARALVSFLKSKRILSGEPANIAELTEKYKIEPNPKPIPLPILRAIWNAADAEFQGYMLLALNFGFRQTEIQSLDHQQLKVVSRRMCVVKLRGKTGQPIALPMWEPTQRFIKKFANPEGRLFNFQDGKDAMAVLQHRMKTIRTRVAEKLPKAADYSFQHFRDTGASYCDTVNPMLTTLYLAQGDKREAKQYVAAIEDEQGETIIPMQMDQVLAGFEKYLSLPAYKP